MKKFKEFIVNAIDGFCMALADSVPGVSGGTVAFIMGFYDNFINSLNNLFRGKKEERVNAIKYLIKLGIGWVIGMGLASIALTKIFEGHIYQISSLFLGFIIFAIPLIIKEEKKTIKGNYKHLIYTIIGIAIVSLITYFNPVQGSGLNIDVSSLNIGLILYVFFAGMVAISAMILPGISGSTLLMIFGLYMPIINAIKEFLHLNLNYLPVLIIFGLGVIAGIVLVIKLVKIALEKYRSQTIYCVIGLMIGSLYAIIMGPTTLKNPQSAMGLSTFSIIFFLIGGLVVWGMDYVKNIMEKTKQNNENLLK